VGAAEAPLPLPDKPSIAVLPFANMSGDPEQDYFADGMVEEIITALSRIRWLFVIARNSSFTYKGKADAPLTEEPDPRFHPGTPHCLLVQAAAAVQ
jgi:TolB-like protein